jgi:hypothetical protein
VLLKGLPALQLEMIDLDQERQKKGIFEMGETFIYELVVENDVGTALTPDLKIVWNLPKELEFVSGSGDRGATVTGTGGQSAESSAFVLAPNQVLKFELVVKVVGVPERNLIQSRASVVSSSGGQELATETESTTLSFQDRLTGDGARGTLSGFPGDASPMCLTCLWLPILLSAVAVFVASSILWMATPVHKGDFRPLEGSEEMAAWLARKRPPAARYMIGWCQPGEERQAPADPNAPRGILLVQYGGVNMGGTLLKWFLNVLVLSLIVGYLASAALAAGTGFTKVFQVAGCTAFLAHGGGAVAKCIWEGAPWAGVKGSLIDALVYGLATGAIFGAFWPAA